MRKRSLTRSTDRFIAKLVIIIWSLMAISSFALFKSEFFRNLSPDKRKVSPFRTIGQLAALLEKSDYFIGARPGSPEMFNLLQDTEMTWEPLRRIIRTNEGKLRVIGPTISEAI